MRMLVVLLLVGLFPLGVHGGFPEAVSVVNNWVRSPQYRSMRYGEVFPKPKTFTNRSTVGAPLVWWK